MALVLNLIRRAWNGPVQAADLERGFASLGLEGGRDAIVHSSLSAFGYVAGGADTVIGALRGAVRTVVAPAFTYYTQVWPPGLRTPDWPKSLDADGPAFRLDSPVSADIGRVPQTLLGVRGARRSGHPALSFVAVGQCAAEVLAAQRPAHPYAPIGVLYALDADVLLLGVDHRSNTTVHYGEYLAGRPLLDRYAQGPEGVVHTYFPNCSAGFGRLEPQLATAEATQIGRAIVLRMRVRDVVDATVRLLAEDPEALLCTYSGCRCQAVRERVREARRWGGLAPRTDGLAEAFRPSGSSSVTRT